MKINLNGNVIETQKTTLEALVVEKKYNPDTLVAEVNFKVIRQEFWNSLKIQDGDVIELLNFVGGG